ncbi:MAG: hypothetical protein RJA07_1423 [Bacteroidota bacterium]|jgi:predicted nucleic acid-binding protein
MNIFLDTSVLYSDPFWKENFTSQLLEVSADKRINIFISEVVLQELRHNFEKNIDKEFFDIRKSNSNLKKTLLRFKQFEIPNKDECLLDFDNFYSHLQKYKNVQILNLNNDFLPIVLERAVKRKKPFTEKKTELKDALIWLTYSTYVNQNNLDNCIFITENSNDFCDVDKMKNKVFELHPELLLDSDKFKLHLSIKDFYKANSDWLDKPKLEFKTWFDSQNIDDVYVFDLLWGSKIDKVNDEITHHIDSINPRDIFEDSHLISMGGYIQVGEVIWDSCSNIESEIVGDYAIISGTLTVNTEVQGYGYNSARDPGDEKFPFVGEENIDVDLDFSFTLDINGSLDNFEILNVTTN